MAASEGVDLEWAIVELARGDKPSRKYSARILQQAKQSVSHIKGKLGNKIKIYHSDENVPGIGSIYANPEPKTDIVIFSGAKKYFVSVKMEGGIQLASGQGASTAALFEAAADKIKEPTKRKVLKQIINEVSTMPTKLLSEDNLSRIKNEGNKKVIDEFIKDGKIKRDKSLQEWMENKKPALMNAIMKFAESNPEFHDAIIREALTGEKTLKQFKGAVANSVVSPAGFFIIDNGYVRKIRSKIKMDIRAKSRGGISSIAFRIETRGSL